MSQAAIEINEAHRALREAIGTPRESEARAVLFDVVERVRIAAEQRKQKREQQATSGGGE